MIVIDTHASSISEHDEMIRHNAKAAFQLPAAKYHAIQSQISQSKDHRPMFVNSSEKM